MRFFTYTYILATVVAFVTPQNVMAAPARVLTLAASPGGAGQMVVTFTQPAPQAGCTLTANVLKMSTKSITALNFNTATTVSGVTLGTVGQTVTVTASGLTPGGIYYFAQKGVDSCGTSAMSNLAQGQVAVVPTPKSVSFAWDEVLDDRVVTYELCYGSLSGTYDTCEDTGGLTDVYMVEGLNAGAQYYFAVRASDGMGVVSPFSNEVGATMPYP